MDDENPHGCFMQCKAKSKQSGQQCKRHAVPGRDVCAIHGGKTPRGFALPQTKTARWSKDLPPRLASRYAETEHDPDLMSLRQDIRLVDVLLQDDLTRLDSGENGEAWAMMRKAVDALAVAINNSDPKIAAKVPTTLQGMRTIIDKRILHFATVEEIRLKLDQRRKLVETEAKITLAGEQAISIEKAMMLIGAIAGILKTHIHDPNTLAAIQTSIGQLLDASETAR
jgi:hypothetical protein